MMTSSPRKRRVSNPSATVTKAEGPTGIETLKPLDKTIPSRVSSSRGTPNTSKLQFQKRHSRDQSSPSEHEQAVVRLLQSILDDMPQPAPLYQVHNPIGSGTFSTVFHASLRKRHLPGRTDQNGLDSDDDTGWPMDIAVKHIVPTSSPERVYIEVECLRMANGEHHVIPLHFAHRLGGEVILAMPLIKQRRFTDTLLTLRYSQMVQYMKCLFEALAHIHSLGIIHRDIKPANFLYDFQNNKFGLTDFGLAQLTGEVNKELIPSPPCKRKITDENWHSGFSDINDENSTIAANSVNSPKKKKPKLSKDSPRKTSRTTATATVTSTATATSTSTSNQQEPKTPPKWAQNSPAWSYYHSARGGLEKRTNESQWKQSMAEEYAEEAQESWEQEKVARITIPDLYAEVTTKVRVPMLRRSPRKHQPVSRKHTGFSKLTISGSTILGSPTPTSIKRTPSFTMLDPTSGIPSHPTAGLQASLTSRSLNTATSNPPINRFNTPSLIEFARCPCFGKPQTCPKCLSRRSQKVARAGTAGFRPPEVLLKSDNQTYAMDVWAAGVILLCMMSRTYPFFRAPDDMVSLAELTALFGTKAMNFTACQMGKRFICSERIPPAPIADLCTILSRRYTRYSSVQEKELLATPEAVDLWQKTMALAPNERMTAQQALNHPFFTSDKSKT